MNDHYGHYPAPKIIRMSVDRLQELRRRKNLKASNAPTNQFQPEPEGVEMVKLQDGTADVELQQQLYQPINALIVDIGSAADNLIALKHRDNKSTDENSRKKILSDMNSINGQCMSKAGAVKDALMQIKDLNDKFDKEEEPNSARAQIRHNLYQSTCRRFQEEMARFCDARDEFRVNVNERMIRQIQIIDPSTTEEQAQIVIDNGQASQIITRALASDNLRETVVELRARNQELLALQRNVEQLFELFSGLHQLIAENGEMINVIAARIERSLDYVQKGEELIKQASHHQNKAKKLICIVIFILMSVFILVLTPIMITTGVGKPEGGGGEE